MADSEQRPEIRSFSEFREAGLLWLVNRVVFHPRGLALGFVSDDEGNVLGWVLRVGPEPWQFSQRDDNDGMRRVEATIREAMESGSCA